MTAVLLTAGFGSAISCGNKKILLDFRLMSLWQTINMKEVYTGNACDNMRNIFTFVSVFTTNSPRSGSLAAAKMSKWHTFTEYRWGNIDEIWGYIDEEYWQRNTYKNTIGGILTKGIRMRALDSGIPLPSPLHCLRQSAWLGLRPALRETDRPFPPEGFSFAIETNTICTNTFYKIYKYIW